MKLKASYALMVVVLLGALWAGTHDTAAATPDERAHSLEQSIKCPVCRGQSVLESDSPAALAIRTEVERRIADGQSDVEIRQYVVDKLGADLLLRPPQSGWAGLVWVLPIVGLVVAGAAIALAFVRWRRWGNA